MNRLIRSIASLCYLLIAGGLSFLLMSGQPALAEDVRVMAANLTSGNSQTYNPGEGIRIFQGLKPDIVLIQEFKYGDNSRSALRDMVDLAFDPSFAFSVEPDFERELPNGIISRFPIIESGEWKDNDMPNRDFAWARIDVPGDRDVLAVSLHLKAGNARRQQREANTLVEALAAVDLTDTYLIIGGDFNTRSRNASAIGVLSAVVDTASPYPIDQAGDPDTNMSRRRPYDAIYVDQDLEALEVPVAIADETFEDGLVFDSRVYSPLEDVSPVAAGDSGVQGMQHMAVVREFDFE